MKKLSFDYSSAQPYVLPHEISQMAAPTETAAKLLDSRKGPGNDFLGWLDLPKGYDRTEFKRIKAAAKRIQQQSEVLVVIGIGGSYLGAKAAIEMLSHSFYNNLPKKQRKTPEIYFAGTNISPVYLTHLLELIGDRHFSVNVISKSGTTTEPAIAFRILKQKLEEKYGREGAQERIYATTDKEKGALKKLAVGEGYETFIVPDDVGGRFSVLTAVGLLPIAVAGISMDDLMKGAADAAVDCKAPFEKNACLQYAALRNILYNKGKAIEMLINYEPRLHFVAEWWKQLYGESEGKDGKGLFTASADFTTDLHSLGQYIQDGRRHIFETLLNIEQPECDVTLEAAVSDLDGLNYLAGKTMDFVNKKAAEGTLQAHTEGGVPNLRINLPEASAFHLGYLFFFFEKACAVSGYLLGVNPFDQPGVEAYKKNMFRLLGKP
ncbi:MAG: glucose-6-phosphate isomerase [Saprospiraceae bacterium]|nr:glucose-6-phosphate isomerase [Saprospiraceae bacterium]MCF8250324.1 glucose-6-phosphate isomerase [Saprospiraceae bacterium]MCF8281506.1 glucose-6-phosphate isomerase [Bacteroidales bacterium]MCF8312132.1 glucose-6-phosphate isomerase [Saprospiraceae bacterium]MCF8442184.1 glucose-6-phosphate isomerase [Saprospiraceae bacterium]